MKVTIMYSLIALMLPIITLANNIRNDTQDTVIIELNNSKITIVTESKEDLVALENYDINQMIKDLNKQHSDSVKHMEINGRKVYVNKDEKTEMKDWKISDDEIRIKLGGVEVGIEPDEVDDWDDDFWKDRKKVTYETKRTDKTTHHFNVDIGLNNWIERGNIPVGPYAVKPFGSWSVGLNNTNRTWIRGCLFLEWGLGVHWYNWKLEDENYIIQEKADKTTFNLSPSTQNGIKSKLTASFINITVVPMIDFSKGGRKITSIKSNGFRIKRYSRKGFRFGLGAYVGYKVGSHTKFKYKENGSKGKDKEKDGFYLENFRYGLRAQIGWKGIDLFATYDLNNVFHKGHGPELNAMSFGITL